MHFRKDLGTILGGIWDGILGDFFVNIKFLRGFIFYQILNCFWNGFWRQLGVVLARLGTSWAALGLTWARLVGVLGVSSRCFGGVQALGAALGAFWDHFETILGPFCDGFGPFSASIF